MIHPQEIETWYVIPAIKYNLAKALKDKTKITEIANILATTPSAVSQYLHRKRGQEVKFNKMKKEFEKSANRLIKNKKLLLKEINLLLDLAKKLGITCKVCKKYNKEINKFCIENGACLK
ncbi:MAG: Fis family transcriptional regulator [Candidatus Pacearchaeota archaeon]